MARPWSEVHTQISFLGFHSWNDVYAGKVSAPVEEHHNVLTLEAEGDPELIELWLVSMWKPSMRHTHRAAAPSPRLKDRHHLNDAQSGRDSPSLECPSRIRGSFLEDARKVGITEPSTFVTLEAVKRPLCDVRVDHALELLRHFSELWECNGIQRRLELASEQVLCPAFLWLRNGCMPWRSSQRCIRTFGRWAKGRDVQR